MSSSYAIRSTKSLRTGPSHRLVSICLSGPLPLLYLRPLLTYDTERANETVRDLQAALRFSETTIARHEADKRTMTLRIEYLSSSNARMERVFTESEDLSDSLKTQKMHNLALKEEIGRLKYEIDTLANAQQFYIEKSVQPCKCLLHQLQQVKLGETD